MVDIAEIKRRADLLKMANNKKYCLISELAKELKVRKTDLMQFILDNPKLFHTDNQWTYKVMPRSQQITTDKNLGLGIEEVYLSPEDNFRTDEWLQKQIIDKAKYIHVSEFDYYGVQGYFIKIDKEGDSKYKEHLWRNTESKVKEVKSLGVLHMETFYSGSFGDSSAHPVDHAISPDGLDELIRAGWTFNKLNPLSR